MKIETKFDIGDRVSNVLEDMIQAFIVAVFVYGEDRIIYQCSHINEGKMVSENMCEFELQLIMKREKIGF